MNFQTAQNASKKLFFAFEWGASTLRLIVPGWERTPIQGKKTLFGSILSVKIQFVKSQGIYLESGLVSAFNG